MQPTMDNRELRTLRTRAFELVLEARRSAANVRTADQLIADAAKVEAYLIDGYTAPPEESDAAAS